MGQLNRTERQNEAVNKWIQAKGKGTFEFATGFGKTRCALMIAERYMNKYPGSLILVVVPTAELKKQWLELLSKSGFFMNVEVQIINTIIKNKYDVDLLIIDEIHRIAAPTFLNLFKVVKYKRILGLTATFERLDGKHSTLLHYAPIIDVITVEEAVNNNWLSPYREYKILLDVDLKEYQEADRSFKEHFSFFTFNFNLAMKCANDYRARNELSLQLYSGDDKEIRKNINKQIIHHAMGFIRTLHARKNFIYGHPKKIEITNLIIEHRMDKKIITFSPTIKMAEKIKYGSVLHSKQKNKDRTDSLDSFILADRGVLNSSKALREGIDIPGLNVAIILTGDSSKLNKTQELGRIIRFAPNKEAELFTLVIKGTVDEEWHKKSTGDKKYIILDEKQLMNLLTGKEIVEKKEKETNLMFRF